MKFSFKKFNNKLRDQSLKYHPWGEEGGQSGESSLPFMTINLICYFAVLEKEVIKASLVKESAIHPSMAKEKFSLTLSIPKMAVYISTMMISLARLDHFGQDLTVLFTFPCTRLAMLWDCTTPMLRVQWCGQQPAGELLNCIKMTSMGLGPFTVNLFFDDLHKSYFI